MKGVVKDDRPLNVTQALATKNIYMYYLVEHCIGTDRKVMISNPVLAARPLEVRLRLNIPASYAG